MNKQNRTVSLPGLTLLMVLLAMGSAQAGTITNAGNFIVTSNVTVNGRLTVNSNEFFGATTRQMIDLYSSGPYDYGIGVQTSTLYFRAATTFGGFAWYQGGVHSNGAWDAGGGWTAMTLDSNGKLKVTPNSNAGPAVWGDNPNGTGMEGTSSFGGTGVAGVSGFGNGIYGYTDDGDGVYGEHGGGGCAGAGVEGVNQGCGPGVHGGSVDGRGVLGSSANDIGVYGVTSTAGPTVAGVWGENDQDGGTAIVGKALGANSTGLYAKGTTWAAYFDGNVSLCTLTIRGGCDVAEPFQMSAKDILKGSVVVIDDQNAGQLKRSDRAYDSRVAGIVSGANGINPGIALHQDGAFEGGQNVALSGRVYVLADASNGPIKPGDLLTTSDTPGHAMKVTDHIKAQGAVIGKAMSALKEGKGMVLVLVSLQ